MVGCRFKALRVLSVCIFEFRGFRVKGPELAGLRPER